MYEFFRVKLYFVAFFIHIFVLVLSECVGEFSNGTVDKTTTFLTGALFFGTHITADRRLENVILQDPFLYFGVDGENLAHAAVTEPTFLHIDVQSVEELVVLNLEHRLHAGSLLEGQLLPGMFPACERDLLGGMQFTAVPGFVLAWGLELEVVPQGH